MSFINIEFGNYCVRTKLLKIVFEYFNILISTFGK
jgi:hypothetical protein